MYKSIEYICSGENGRSPIAKNVAIVMLQAMGRAGEMDIRSSGTLVELSGDLRPILKPFLEKAIDREILTPGYRDILERNPQAVLDAIVGHEAHMREDYLLRSLGRSFPHKRTQTIARPDVDLVVPMDEPNKRRVEKIYGASEFSPEIVTLPELAGLDLSLEQDFPETEPDYKVTAAKVEATTRMAMLRLTGNL